MTLSFECNLFSSLDFVKGKPCNSYKTFILCTKKCFFFQFYDVTDIAEEAATEFTEFLAKNVPNLSGGTLEQRTVDQIRERANSIASYALRQDENLLAFAIAAPSLHTVVVNFRDNITVKINIVYYQNAKVLKHNRILNSI